MTSRVALSPSELWTVVSMTGRSRSSAVVTQKQQQSWVVTGKAFCPMLTAGFLSVWKQPLGGRGEICLTAQSPLVSSFHNSFSQDVEMWNGLSLGSLF